MNKPKPTATPLATTDAKLRERLELLDRLAGQKPGALKPGHLEIRNALRDVTRSLRLASARLRRSWLEGAEPQTVPCIPLADWRGFRR